MTDTRPEGARPKPTGADAERAGFPTAAEAAETDFPAVSACAACGSYACCDKSDPAPYVCQTLGLPEGVRRETLDAYADPETQRIIRAAADASARVHYDQLPRFAELVLFAREMGYEKLGLAFCSSLIPEARLLACALEREGFEVSSIVCRAAKLHRAEVDPSLERPQALTCNPLLQARVLNEQRTQLNVIVGLCVGHDILFTQHSDAPVTTFIVRDYAYGHSPAQALHTPEPMLGPADPE